MGVCVHVRAYACQFCSSIQPRDITPFKGHNADLSIIDNLQRSPINLLEEHLLEATASGDMDRLERCARIEPVNINAAQPDTGCECI